MYGGGYTMYGGGYTMYGGGITQVGTETQVLTVWQAVSVAATGLANVPAATVKSPATRMRAAATARSRASGRLPANEPARRRTAADMSNFTETSSSRYPQT